MIKRYIWSYILLLIFLINLTYGLKRKTPDNPQIKNDIETEKCPLFKVDVPSDGSCQFHAVSFLLNTYYEQNPELNEKSINGNQIRNLVAERILELNETNLHPYLYSILNSLSESKSYFLRRKINLWLEDKSKEDLRPLIANYYKNKSRWGDEFTLMIIQDIFGIDIYLRNIQDGSFTRIEPQDSMNNVMFLNFGNFHYDPFLIVLNEEKKSVINKTDAENVVTSCLK